MRVIVLDTNVLVSATRSRNGASFKLLSLVGTGVFDIVLSVPLVVEYEYALTKTSDQLGTDDAAVQNILDYLCSVGKHQQIFFLWRPILRDPGDDMVLEVAVASAADTIVTFNKRDFARSESFGLGLCTPAEFLKSERLI